MIIKRNGFSIFFLYHSQSRFSTNNFALLTSINQSITRQTTKSLHIEREKNPKLQRVKGDSAKIYQKIEGRSSSNRGRAMAGRDLLVILALAMVSSSLLLPKARGNSEGDALYALRRSLTDTDNVLQSWDPNLVNPCTWFHITCNQDNRVTRVYVYV